MTPEEFIAKYFAPEYLNVQHKEDWKAQAKADLEKVLSKPVARKGH